jgi:photosystem II stability/assembly factor-like uncharacterized protein
VGRRWLFIALVLMAGLAAAIAPAEAAAAAPSTQAAAPSAIVSGRPVADSVTPEKAGTSSPSAVRLHRLSRPRITGLSVRSGPVAGGQVVTIRGSSLSHVKAVSFGRLHAAVLGHSTSTRLRVRTPASWAGTVQVVVVTKGGTSARSAADVFTFKNPAPQLTGQLTPATGDVVATGADVTAVTGGQAVSSSTGVSQAPWVVTLAVAAAVPAVGQQYLLKPGSAVYPAGLAGTVTAVDTSTSPATITVSASSGSFDSAVQSAQAVFSGSLSDADANSGGVVRRNSPSASGPSLPGGIDFGSIPASALNCLNSGRSVDVTGSLSLKLEDVQAHVELDVGLLSKPFVDVWVAYQPTLAASLTAEATADCTLSAAWQTTHEKLFVLGDTGAMIAIAPDAAFTVSAGGTVTFQQHSYRMLGFITNPDGSIRQLSGQSSDPAQVKVSGQLKAEAYGGVQVQVGELNAIGVGMSLDGGVAGTVSSDWPPQVCLNVSPFLRGTLYAYLNNWVQEWKLQKFSVELDLALISKCSGTGWHVAWQSNSGGLSSVTCPTISNCFAVGGVSGHGRILRTTNGGQTWTQTTITNHGYFYGVACTDASHCVTGGAGSKVAITSNGGATWSQVSLPSAVSPVSAIGSVACVPGGTCYVTAYMTKYSGELVYGSTNGGKTWTFHTVLDNEPAAMTCLTNSACLAVGEIPPDAEAIVFPAASEATTDGWASSSSTVSFPGDWKSLTNVACLNSSLCYTGGTDLTNEPSRVLATTNFGQTWKAIPDGKIGQTAPWAMSCVIGTMCVLSGEQAVAETLDGGHSWTSTTISKFPAADDMFTISLSCPSLGHCAAIEIGGGPTAIVVS